MCNKVILDIEDFLECIEPICVKYRPFITNEHLVYVRGKRLPLECRCDAGKYPTDFIGHTPFHPIVAAGLAKEVLLDSLVSNQYRKLMLINPLIEEVLPKAYIPIGGSTERIISEFLGKLIDVDDMTRILTTMDSLLIYLAKFNIPDDCILDINIEEKFITIDVGVNIAYRRLQEAGYV